MPVFPQACGARAAIGLARKRGGPRAGGLPTRRSRDRV
jgi:hypothetical protein